MLTRESILRNQVSFLEKPLPRRIGALIGVGMAFGSKSASCRCHLSGYHIRIGDVGAFPSPVLHLLLGFKADEVSAQFPPAPAEFNRGIEVKAPDLLV